MDTFMFIAIAVTCLFVIAVLVIDHVEVSRHNRLTNDPHFQQWMQKSKEERSFEAYLNEIGLTKDCEIEQLVAAHKQHERIIKILRTVS